VTWDNIFRDIKSLHKHCDNYFSVGIKYSMRDLISDVNYCALPANLRCGSYSLIDVSAPFLH